MKAGNSPAFLMAGTARVDITPAGPISMGGFGQRSGQLSRGVHDRLFAKALFLSDGLTRLLFITTDLISIPTTIYSSVLAALTKANVVDGSGLCVSASHTHSGPDVEESLIIASPTREYLSGLEKSLVQVGIDAAANLKMANLKLAVGQADFFLNRRHGGSSGLIDRRVLSIGVELVDTGRLLAVLFGVGCHPVCLGHDNFLVSADFPGYAQKLIEAETGAENALFINLTEGNVIPCTRPLFNSLDTRGYLGGTFEDAARIGNALGKEVVRCLKAYPAEPLTCLRVNKQSVTVKPAHYELGILAAWKQLLQQRRIILEYLPAFKKASAINLKPIFTLWRDASAVVIARNLDEREMRRLMSAVSTFLIMAMKLTNPVFRKPVPITVQTIGLNDFRLLALPGEALVEVGMSWQQRNQPHGGKAFVLGLANGFVGYLPYPDNFKEEDADFRYETIMNALERDATSIALDAAMEMVDT